MEAPRIAFFGSGPFGLKLFDAAQGHGPVVVVITAPARPSGRGLRIAQDPVAQAARARSVPLEQPERLGPAELRRLETYGFDLGLVASYGLIIPPALFRSPPHGFVNVHPSLLPAYRGASPVAAAILDGQTLTGVSLMLMDEGLDTGPIIARDTALIPPDIRRPELEQRLASLADQLLDRILLPYLAGRVRPTPQPPTQDRPTRRLRKTDGLVDWTESAERIERRLRAYDPWPGLWSHWKTTVLKFQDLAPTSERPDASAGTVFRSSTVPFGIVCGTDAVAVERLQVAGRRLMTAEEFLRGARSIIGARLTRETTP